MEASSGGFIVLRVSDEIGVSEKVGADECNFELHDVHGQSASFVSEDVLDLS